MNFFQSWLLSPHVLQDAPGGRSKVCSSVATVGGSQGSGCKGQPSQATVLGPIRPGQKGRSQKTRMSPVARPLEELRPFPGQALSIVVQATRSSLVLLLTRPFEA